MINLKKSVKRVLALSVVAMASTFGAFAADTTDGVFISFTDGSDALQLKFESEPQISMTNGGLVVTTTKLGKELTFEFSDVEKMYFGLVTDETTSGVTETEVAKKASVVFAYADGVVKVSGLSNGETVRVVALNGTVYKSVKATAEGTAEFNIDNAQVGVYIVTTNSLNFKLIKK